MSISIDAYTPTEVINLVARAGIVKGNTRLDKVFLSSVSAGCLLALACGTALSTNTSTWFQENAPGLIRTISALVFPYGLCMIILTGADLCTGSFMVCFSPYSPFPKNVSLMIHTSSQRSRPYSANSPGGRCYSTGSSHFGGISADRYLS